MEQLGEVALQLENGDVTINSRGDALVLDLGVTAASVYTLTLSSAGDIHIDQPLNVGALVLKYGQGTADGAGADYRVTAPVTLPAGNTLVTHQGSEDLVGTTWLVITELGDESGSGQTLQGMANDLTAHYALGTDIDASGTTGWNDYGIAVFAGFQPVGSETTPFSGALEGLGHRISDLYISRADESDVGLFGYADSQSRIRHLEVTGTVHGYDRVGGLVGTSHGALLRVSSAADVSGHSTVGGLAGYTYGTVSLSSATGEVTATGSSIGGLAGQNRAGDSVISESWASGAVNGNWVVGGLVGTNYGQIRHAWASGEVVANNATAGGLVGQNWAGAEIEASWASGGVGVSSADAIGGLLGFNHATGTVRTSYWATDSNTGIPGVGSSDAPADSVVATGLTLSELISDEVVTVLNGESASPVWANVRSQTSPYLPANPGTLRVKYDLAKVYEPVTTLQELQAIASPANYALLNDLDARATAYWNMGDHDGDAGTEETFMGFESLPNLSSRFEGLGNVVSGLTINRPSQSSIGLWKNLSPSSSVVRLGLEHVSVSGGVNVGGVVGNGGYSSIRECYVTGTVSGTNSVGGLAGNLHASSFYNNYVAAQVVGEDRVGGLVGNLSGFTVETSYSNSQLASGPDTLLGGLVGNLADTLYPMAGLWNLDASSLELNAVGSDPTILIPGKTQAELKQLATYTDPNGDGDDSDSWDISAIANDDGSSVWLIDDGNATPILRWQYAR